VLDHDFHGKPRYDVVLITDLGGGVPTYIDIGAFELQVGVTGVPYWFLY